MGRVGSWMRFFFDGTGWVGSFTTWVWSSLFKKFEPTSISKRTREETRGGDEHLTIKIKTELSLNCTTIWCRDSNWLRVSLRPLGWHDKWISSADNTNTTVTRLCVVRACGSCCPHYLKLIHCDIFIGIVNRTDVLDVTFLVHLLQLFPPQLGNWMPYGTGVREYVFFMLSLMSKTRLFTIFKKCHGKNYDTEV